MNNSPSAGLTQGPYTDNTVCAWCGKGLVGKRAQARFCSDRCRYTWHNRKDRPPPNENTPAAATEGGRKAKNKASRAIKPTTLKPLRQGTKRWHVLAHLARGNRITRFDAERACHDHCLNTTISELGRLGIEISRCEITIPGYLDRPTRCCLYWIEAGEAEKAAVILGWRSNGSPA